MLIDVLILIVGVIVVLILANIVIRSTIKLAKHFGWSGAFIGLTILSIGTSIPEIMTAVFSSIDIVKNPSLMQTLSGLVVGTNVGSDIFQQSFILPLVGLVGTIVVIKKNLIKEVGALILGAVLMWFMCFGGVITRLEGFIMLAAYMGYLIYLERQQMHETTIHGVVHSEKKKRLERKNIAMQIVIILLGFIIMGFAANQVIDKSTILVSELAISASFFGVLLLGVASALPELMTALVAVIKGKKDISAGVLIGSNVTNPLMGIGLGALISGYAVPRVTLLYDLPAKIGIALLIFYFLWRNEKLNKWEAIVLIVIFIAYLVLRNLLFPVDF